MPKIVAISDLHGRLPTSLPSCDILLIVGDIAPDFFPKYSQADPDYSRVRQMEWLRFTFSTWEKTVDAKHIWATPGNHDWFHQMPEECRTELMIDEGREFDGLTFWFTPWIPPVAKWNYMLPRAHRKDRFDDIPQRVDVLASHCPPLAVVDKMRDGQHVGCPELRRAIYDKKPRHVFCGHIHECGGQSQQLGTSWIHNVAWYRGTPREFEI